MKLLTPKFRASLLSLVLLAAGAAAVADPVSEPAGRDGQHGFDFFVGTWKQHNRRLKNPLTGSTTWYEFDSQTTCRPVWGGKANMDEFESYTAAGRIQGRAILVRYIWGDIKPDSYHWEQAFSLDGGKTWETNWVTDGTRVR